MKIDTVLSKLEKRSRIRLRCDWCRYALHDISPSKQKTYAADQTSHIKVSCPYCGTEFTVDVSTCDEHEREATILYYKHRNGAAYRDERVFAATHWLIQSRLLKRWRSGDLDKEKVEARKKAKEQNHYQQRYEKKKEGRYTRERAEMKERAYSFLQRMNQREEKEYAPHTFPLASEVEAIEKPDRFGFVPGSYKKMEFEEIISRKILYSVRVMETCERVLWGAVLSETQAAIDELHSIIQRFEDARAEQARKEEEEKAQLEAARQQRERERLARVTQPRIEPSSYYPNR